MPELAASYVVGALCTLLLTAYFCFSILKKARSVEQKSLQLNLAKISHYWSIAEGRILPGAREDIIKDQKKMLRSALLLGGLFTLLSWLGLIFLAVMIVSFRFLAVSRLEKKVFASALAKDPDLSAPEVTAQIQALSSN